MASGRETPRQKMIGMMYLVLTALLALNVSNQILKGFVTVDESIERSNEILSENNKQIEAAFLAYVNQGNTEARPYYEKSLETKTKISQMISYIDSMKMHLISKTEKTSRPDTSQIRYMKNLEDYDTPTYLFIGSDETKPVSGKYTALELKTKLTDLSDQLKGMIANMQKNKKTKLDEEDLRALNDKLKNIRPVDRKFTEDGITMNWEQENFYHIPAAAIITNMDKMQTDLKNLESEFLHVFAASSSKYIPKFNKLEAKVIAPTAYIQTGQAFKADILLTAGSTELTNDKMKVMIGAEYDSVNKKLLHPGNSIVLENGVGKFESIGSAIGPQNINGVIAYKNPKGEEEYYPFNYSYMVAPPFSTIGADNMNVLYTGVENPITVSAAGIAPSNLKIQISGCGATIKTNNAGKYSVFASSVGTCTMTVLANTPEGLKAQGAPKIFRVKQIPPPIAKINGKPAISTLEFKKTEIAAINYIGATCLGFDFPVKMSIESAEVTTLKNGAICTPGHIKNGNPDGAADEIFKKVKQGQQIWIENIKANINGQIQLVPNVTIKCKG